MATLTQDIQEKEAELSHRLEGMRDEALARVAPITGPATLHQMHAHIGRNNNTFVDSVRMQFHSPDDFIARWLNGLTNLVHERREAIARRLRIPLIPATHSTRRLPPSPGQGGHVSERSDAGVILLL